MVFHWRLSESKSPQVSRTLVSILAVFNNAVVWMVSTRSPTSKSSKPFNNPLVIVPKVPITIGITVTFMFQQDQGTYLSFHILLVLFCGLLGQQSRQFCIFPFFLLIIIRSGHRAEIRWFIIIIFIIIIYSFRGFHIIVTWWFFTGVWVTASLLKSPGLVSGFWSFSAMLIFG